MLAFTCPQCGVPLRVEDCHAGQPVQCGSCRRIVKAPAVCVPASSQAANEIGADADLKTLPPSLPGASVDGLAPRVGAANASPLAGKDSYSQVAALLAPPQSAGELGRLGPYRVLSVLGVGGMGVVFRAEDSHLQRRVALKVLLPALIANPISHQRFLREARALAAIEHDHVVALYQVGEERGIPFLVMQLLEGESLEDRLRREGRLPIREVLRIGREAAAGLAAIHALGVIHRDIKPANLWLEGGSGRVKLFDFGLACTIQGGAHLTKPGTVIGSPGYMAPEQIRGSTVDQRSDLFSLGCVLYRLCTGELPFKGTDTISILAAIATQAPRPPEERNPAVPRALAALVMQLLSKEPDGRPSSATAVVAAITSIESAEPVPVLPRSSAASPVGRPRTSNATSRDRSQRSSNEREAQGPVVLDDDPTAKLSALDGKRGGRKPRSLLPLLAGCIVLLGISLIGTGSFAAWWLLRDRPGESPSSTDVTPHPDVPSKSGEERWTVLFRSDDPRRWNMDCDGKDYAIALLRAPATIHYLRLRRMDTKEMLILPLSRAQLDKATQPAEPKGYSWNGTAKEEWGALHLGIATAPRHRFPIPRNMITLMSDGWDGWGGSGFGHQAFNDNTGQYYAWRGEQMPRTVFEIAVTDQPLTAEEERCLLKP
jgi:serine/threonine protein kinase